MMLVLRIALAALLVIPSALRLFAPAPEWVMPLLPGSVLLLASAVEVALAIVLLSRWWLGGAWAVLGFALALQVATAALSMNGWDLTGCGCFGGLRLDAGPHLAITQSMILLAGAILWRGRVPRCA